MTWTEEARGQPPQPLRFQTVWVEQERRKDTVAWHVMNSLPIISSSAEIEGGWGINTYYAADPRWYIPIYGFVSNKVNSLTREQAITKPLFTPFRIHVDKMHSLDPYDGSDENSSTNHVLSGKDWLRARFLSDAIPATSRAAGANYINAFGITRNVQMDTTGDAGCMSNVDKWPRIRQKRTGNVVTYQWHHSDFKQLAYFFVHKLFGKFINSK